MNNDKDGQLMFLWEWGGEQHYESCVKPGDSDF